MTPLQLDTHTTLHVRPIEPTDRGALATAFARLGSSSRMRRFLGPKHELSERELSYLTELDHETHEALVALDGEDIVAVARYAAWPSDSRESAELAMVVLDSWQRRGIGLALTAQVIARAAGNGFCRLTATTFGDNLPSRALLGRLGFEPASSGDGLVSYELGLPAAHRRRPAPGEPVRPLMRLGEIAAEIAIRRPGRKRHAGAPPTEQAGFAEL
ncbi:MAG TPA: GNAT family N-acetyltransferase [Thermoleophilaceae bacterium]